MKNIETEPLETPTDTITSPTELPDEVAAPTLDSVFDALEHAIAARDNAAGVATTATDSVVSSEQRLETAQAAATQANVSVNDAILAKNAAIDTVVAFLNGMRETV